MTICPHCKRSLIPFEASGVGDLALVARLALGALANEDQARLGAVTDILRKALERMGYLHLNALPKHIRDRYMDAVDHLALFYDNQARPDKLALERTPTPIEPPDVHYRMPR